jgi:hypothetical protein
MAERKSLDGLKLRDYQGTRVMALGDMEIWDGADLALLRDGLNHVILTECKRTVAVDMSYVKYVPSGFFGMLFDWYEKGITIRLLAPQERVANMLWFKQFCRLEGDGWYILYDGVPVNAQEKPAKWGKDQDWKSRDDRASAVAAGH